MKKAKVLRIIAIISGVVSIVLALSPIIENLMIKHMIGQYAANLNNASTIGIIGGTDGPTAIFVTQPSTFHLVLRYGITAICAMISILSIMLFKKRKKHTD